LIETKLIDRMLDHARQWGMVVDNTFETETSVMAFGFRGVGARESQPVVLKIIKREGDEWRSGEVLKAFGGVGVARVYEHAPGAVLLERLRPGSSLVEVSLSGKDAEATEVLAGVIEQMSLTRNALVAYPEAPTLSDWARSFERYIATRDTQLPKELVESAGQLYLTLCASQLEPRLLHGDLQHYNVLVDSERGWLAIDPKGVVGEMEYEIGAILRNPIERPELFTARAIIDSRAKRFAERLGLDYGRILSWAFAQAVLSAIWDIEDGFPVDAMNPALRLAGVLQPMLRTFQTGKNG
jgi:streptomycin 6-kinase